MRIVSLHRFPVKAMGGEDLDAVSVDGRGLAHDRVFAVLDRDGMFAAGKRGSRWRPHEAVFGFSAAVRDDAVVVARGDAVWEAGSPGLDDELSAAMGEPMRVAAETPGETDFFDAKPVSLVGTATLDWCREELGADADPRRLRVNVVVETDEPFVEESWIGSRIALGGVALDVVKRNTRCRVIDQAQNGAAERTRWLKPLGDRRDGCVAVYATVATPGTLAVGDPVAPPSPGHSARS